MRIIDNQNNRCLEVSPSLPGDEELLALIARNMHPRELFKYLGSIAQPNGKFAVELGGSRYKAQFKFFLTAEVEEDQPLLMQIDDWCHRFGLRYWGMVLVSTGPKIFVSSGEA